MREELNNALAPKLFVLEQNVNSATPFEIEN